MFEFHRNRVEFRQLATELFQHPETLGAMMYAMTQDMHDGRTSREPKALPIRKREIHDLLESICIQDPVDRRTEFLVGTRQVDAQVRRRTLVRIGPPFRIRFIRVQSISPPVDRADDVTKSDTEASQADESRRQSKQKRRKSKRRSTGRERRWVLSTRRSGPSRC